MYVACATAVVLKTEDSEKAKRTDRSQFFYESLTHFPLSILLNLRVCELSEL